MIRTTRAEARGGLGASDDDRWVVMGLRRRLQVALSYVTFVLVGVSAGVGGVVLPAQMSDYGVDRTTIGITFFTFSAGFMLAGTVTGGLLHRVGFRWALVAGGGSFVLSGLYQATRPPLAGLIAVQLLAGLGIGTVETVLNAHLTTLPGSSVLLGRLHAFFGVGALLGPLLATWTLREHAWTAVAFLTAVPFIPVVASFVLTHGDTGEVESRSPQPPTGDGEAHPRGLLRVVVRQPPVLLAAVFLSVYVGLEVSVGDWGFSYLIGERHRSDLVAGNGVSGFWLGLTAGRFVIAPVAERLRWPISRTTTVCLVAVTVTSLVVWTAPPAWIAVGGLGALGFFLGPLFPTTMAVMPLVTERRYVAAAIGVLNGVSVIGGSALPWLAGALTQSIGLGTLLPYVAVLAVIQLVIWRRLVPVIDAASTTAPTPV